MDTSPTVSQITRLQFHSIIQSNEILDAWQWLLSNLSIRPPQYQPSHCCVYDNKLWGPHPHSTSLRGNDPETHLNLARLFIISQLKGDIDDIMSLITGNSAQDCGIFTPKIEDSIKAVVRSPKRFRHALSEHLAFWTQFAYAFTAGRYVRFSLTPPNFLPEDKGPDGLLLAITPNSQASVEIRSVKSSQGNPRYLVASGHFRQTGKKANPNKQIEEFQLIAQKGYGFIRLNRLLANAYHDVGVHADEFIRASILQESRAFNSIVVANDSFANYDLFSCYHYISQDPNECIATYIGSDNWLQVAEQVRVNVLHCLKQAKVW